MNEVISPQVYTAS